MIPYKGGALAIRAFARADAPGSRLVFLGDGPERARLESLVASLGLRDRVVFEGRIPRKEVLERMGTAAALLHPALHDDSPLTVAEALSIGTPVICLDRGGPPVLCSLWPNVESHVVEIGSRSAMMSGLAEAVERAVAAPAEPAPEPLAPARSFGDQLLKGYAVAMERT
jgi:hypothetical protein